MRAPTCPIFNVMAGKKKSVAGEKLKAVPLDDRMPVHHMLDGNVFTSTSGEHVDAVRVQEIYSLLWLEPELDEVERYAKLVKAIDLFNSLKPADGLEAMLATQMVGTHNAAVECLRRAMISNQSSDGIQLVLSQAERLMGLYLQQVAALDKHRGRGQQKITVERVQVAAGGQAIVGNVQAAPSAVPDPPPPQDALSAPVDDTVPLPVGRAKSKVPR
jgi:hypothetical protein